MHVWFICYIHSSWRVPKKFGLTVGYVKKKAVIKHVFYHRDSYKTVLSIVHLWLCDWLRESQQLDSDQRIQLHRSWAGSFFRQMEKKRLLDRPEFSRALGFSHRRKRDPEKEGTAAFGCKRANQSRSVRYIAFFMTAIYQYYISSPPKLSQYFLSRTNCLLRIGYNWCTVFCTSELSKLHQINNYRCLFIYVFYFNFEEIHLVVGFRWIALCCKHWLNWFKYHWLLYHSTTELFSS